jgi:hypothetical protein
MVPDEARQLTMEEIMSEVLTPESTRWEEFVDRMEGPEGLRLKRGRNGQLKWYCSSDLSCPLATAILKSMGGINIPRTLKYFRSKGGFCDCEILMNVPFR